MQILFLGNAFGQSYDSLMFIANKQYEEGENEQALVNISKAVKAAEMQFGKEHENYGMCLGELGILYYNLDKNDTAVTVEREAVSIIKKRLGAGHPNYSYYLHQLAIMYNALPKYDTAILLYNETLVSLEKGMNTESEVFGQCLSNLAQLYDALGQNDKALFFYKKTIYFTEKCDGKESRNYAIDINNLATFYRKMGQYEKALSLHLEALLALEKSQGKDDPEYGTFLNNIAVLYRGFGEYDKALPLSLEALSNGEKNFGKEDVRFAKRLIVLGSLYCAKEDYEKALPLYLNALSISRDKHGQNHPVYANYLQFLAKLYFEIGQYENAISLYQESISITDKSLGKDHSSYGKLLSDLADVYVKTGIIKNAIPLYSESKNNIMRRLDKNFTFLTENEKEKFISSISNNFKIYKNFFQKNINLYPSISEEAFDLELATKGMILNAGMEMRQKILNSGDKITLKIYDNWIKIKNELAKQYTKSISYRDSTFIVLNEEKANDLEAQLTRLSNTFKESKSLLSTHWQDIQKALIRNEVAIEFSSFNYYNGKKMTDSILYVALVLRKNDSFPFMIPMCEQKQLDTLLTKKGMKDAEFIGDLYSSSSSEKRLFDLVWKPLDSLLNKGDKIYFAPSGSLHQIAFSAIPYNSTTLLSDRYTLTQLSSTAMLLREPKFKETLPPTMKIFGGIQYDVTEQELLALAEKDKMETGFVSRSLPEDLNRGNNWKYLPGTFTEAKTIDSVAKQKKIEVSLYSGKEATEEKFKFLSGNNSPRVLHFATHGFFFPDPKKQNLNDFGDDRQQVFRSSDNPLNRAGLLLAGANKAWKGDTLPANVEDGILTAYEVSNVSLNNTELVVLSACETGLGDIKGSEGVFGLQRAFKMAGAEYLLMSLWKVPDVETTELMTKFYSTWFSGKTIPEAFHLTQTYMKSKYPNDPYKWAAFVLVE